MDQYFVDLHVHIGRTNSGRPVKITASRDLTFGNIVKECAHRKGIQVVGIIDAGSPAVQEDIRELISYGELREIPGGGLAYTRGETSMTAILGAEVETTEHGGEGFHVLCYFPFLGLIEEFSRWLSGYQTNVTLSSQRARLSFAQLWEQVQELGGIVIPAHAFTPHKGMYGCCCRSIKEVLPAGAGGIAGLELGLSADSWFADHLAELGPVSFLTNSDAHSLPKIGREYNLMVLAEPSFEELVLALKGREGRRIIKNFGLDPKLGKYHRTYCLVCEDTVKLPPPVFTCPRCGAAGNKVVNGVLDRLKSIADSQEPQSPPGRPPYQYQVPLQFLPKVGAKTLDKLLASFGTEMAVLHRVPGEDLARVAGESVAGMIIAARAGELSVIAGGGGRYGKVTWVD